MTHPAGTDLRTRRLRLADIHGFASPDAGPARREALTALLTDWLADNFRVATDGLPVEGLALAAVGSLGRRQLGPASDLDLVLVHSGRHPDPDRLRELADRLWYPIWDAGLRLDHSVRDLAGARHVAAGDLAAAVGLLDLACIAGDAAAVQAMRASIAHDWRAEARRRFDQVQAGVSTRHTRHGDLEQSLEPDLKEARGGLRDVTVLRALREAWLADGRGPGVDEAEGVLLDVRDALHVVTGRARDRLVREDHDAVAALLGHADRESLLTQVGTAGRTITHALDTALRAAGQAQRARRLRIGPRRPRLTPLAPGVFVHDGEVVLGSAAIDPADVTLPLRVAASAARARLPLSPATLTNLAAVPAPPQPWSDDVRERLTDFLASGPGLIATWQSLDQAGIIDGWVPEWAAVRSRPQFSPVHRHTVDRHLLETVVAAIPLRPRVARPDLLLLAGLLHDIGKVADAGDHSAEGARRAATITARWGVPAADAAILVHLVAHHLTLMDLATRRDVHDPATVRAAVSAVAGRADVLELLLSLTEADARAAGPAAWTTWRAQLLHPLGDATRAALATRPAPPASLAPAPTLLSPRDHGLESLSLGDRGGASPESRAAQVAPAAPAGAAAAVVPADPAEAASAVVPADPAGAAAPAAAVVPAAPVASSAPGVRAPAGAGVSTRTAALAAAVPEGDRDRARAGATLIRCEPLGELWRIVVVAADRPGLFADTAGVLAVHALTVRAAEIHTDDAVAVDQWLVESPRRDAPDPAALARALTRVATGDREPLRRLHAAASPALRSADAGVGGPGQARAFVGPGASDSATVIEVRAPDRRGLLHDVGVAFARLAVHVRSAHIATYSGQSADTFYLIDGRGRPLTPGVAAQVVAAVIDASEA